MHRILDYPQLTLHTWVGPSDKLNSTISLSSPTFITINLPTYSIFWRPSSMDLRFSHFRTGLLFPYSSLSIWKNPDIVGFEKNWNKTLGFIQNFPPPWSAPIIKCRCVQILYSNHFCNLVSNQLIWTLAPNWTNVSSKNSLLQIGLKSFILKYSLHFCFELNSFI